MDSTPKPFTYEGSNRALSCARSHIDALAGRLAANIRTQNYEAAFRDADRLCRIAPRPEARIWSLRAQALIGLDRIALARRDLASAFALDPTDLSLSRIILSGAFHSLQSKAAQSVISSVRADRATIELALGALMKESMSVAGNLRVDQGSIKGWIAWLGGPTLTMSIRNTDGSTRAVEITGQVEHRFASSQRFASDINISIPTDFRPELKWCLGSAPMTHTYVFLRESVLPGEDVAVRLSSADFAENKENVSRGCTVIVPVHSDLKATAACLDSLRHQGDGPNALDVILVNDNPADRKMAALTSEAAEREGYTLLTNPVNLGFVHSVNRALAVRDIQKDVVLLNSDVVLPDGCVRRLSEAAYSAQDIGTVTPLSNNGELTSFPQPFRPNPMQTREGINTLNAIAGKVNRDRIITIPNGVGFCLFIKRVCLDVLGGLSTSFLRGYYEDVEFCLRVREIGFRNVCATNVYIGHEGNRSFKDEKRALVARNLRSLQRQFPYFLTDSLAFVKADPLAKARKALELSATTADTPASLLIGDSFDCVDLERRVSELQRNGLKIFTLVPDRSGQLGKAVEICSPPDTAAIRFNLSGDRTYEELIGFLNRNGVREIEIFTDCGMPNELVKGLADVGFKIRYLVGRAPFSHAEEELSQVCLSPEEMSPCSICKNSFAKQVTKARDEQALFHGIDACDDSCIIAQNRMAAALLKPKEPSEQKAVRPGVSAYLRIEAAKLGILYPRCTPRLDRFLRLMIRSLPQRNRPEIIVIGQTLDDAALFSHPLVFVTGPVREDDYDEILRDHGIKALLSPDRWASFALIDELSGRHGIPKAYFDWSFENMEASARDLVLDPRVCDAKAVAALQGWLGAGGKTD